MAQLVSLTGVTKNGQANTGTYLMNGSKMSSLQASGTDAIFLYREAKSTVRWQVDETYSAITALTLNYDAGKRVAVTVVTRNGVAIGAARSIEVDRIIYVYADSTDATQSYITYDGGGMEFDKYLVSHTVAAILALANVADDITLEDIICESIKIEDDTTTGKYLFIKSDSDGTVLTADRSFTVDVNNADRILDLSENLTIGDGYDVTITAEDVASSITLDEQTVEFEGEGTATQLMKFVNAANAAATLTFSGTSMALTGGTNTFTIAAGTASLDVATAIDVDIDKNLTVNGSFGTVLASEGQENTVTLNESLTVGDGYDVTITAEDVASSITLDEQTFEVEGEGTATRLLKLVNANDAAATLTIAGTSGAIDQDVQTTAAPGFIGVNLTVPAADRGLVIDAATTAHTDTDPLVDIELQVSTTVTTNAVDVAITHGTGGMSGGTEVVKSFNTSLTGLAANADGSAVHGFYGASAPVSGERAYYSIFTADVGGVRDTADTDAGLTIGFTGTQATSTSYGTRISATTNTHTSGTWYGHYVNHTSDVVAGLVYGQSINVDASDYNNPKYGMYISKTLTGAATADRTNSANGAEVAVSSTNTTAGDFDMLTTANTLRTSLTHTVNSGQVKSNADTLSGRAFYASVSGVTTQANDALTITSPVMLAEYNITETAGTLTMGATNLVGIEYNTAGTPTYGNVDVNMFSVVFTDASTPVYDGSGTTVSGLSFDFTSMTDAANLSLYGVHFDMPAFATATMAHIRAEESLITDMPVPLAGTGISDAADYRWIPFGRRGASGVIVTELYVDITGLRGDNVLNDVIGNDGGTANATFGQITAAIHGAVTGMEIICIEAPTGADTDIDFSTSTAGTIAETADITGAAGYVQLLASGAAWTLGRVEWTTALPAADSYLYLSCGAGGAGDADYTAGKFIIRIYGT